MTVNNLHKAPVHILTVSLGISCTPLCKLLTGFKYSHRYDTVISADENGFVEYWQPDEHFEPPKDCKRIWTYKSATDLYEFKKVCHSSFYHKPTLTSYKDEMLSNVDRPVTRLKLICYFFSSGQTSSHILFSIGEDDTQVRRIPKRHTRNATSWYCHLPC